MSLRTTIADAFNIRSGEGLPILLLGSYSFLAGICLAYVISLGNASFLVAFGTEYLPQGYIATGVVGYLVGSMLSVLQRRLSFSNLIVVCLGAMIVTTCSFWVGYRFPTDMMLHGLTLGQWLALGLFVGIGPFIMLVYFVFRSVAGRLFDLRQGKRLFGLISTGDVISSMLGFFSVPVLLRILPKPTDLLVIAGVSLCLCLWVLFIIRHKFAHKLSDPMPTEKTTGDSGVWGVMFGSRYFLLLLLLASATVFGFYYIDFVFLAQLRTRFPDQKLLAQFIGIFYGAIRVVEFILKTSVSGRLINQYGLRFGLVVLPALLCVCSALASGLAFGGAPSWVFLILALNKLIERVVTKSLYDPAFSVLYQPVDSKLRLSVQTRVEGIVQQLTVVVAGSSLLLFGYIGSFQLVLNVLVLVFVGWLVVSVLMNRAYRESLLQHLAQRSRHDHKPGQNEVSAFFLADQVKSAPSGQGILALDLLEQIDRLSLPNFYKQGLAHRDVLVRRAVLQKIEYRAMVSLLPEVAKLKSASDVQHEAEATMASLQAIESHPLSLLHTWLDSEDVVMRRQAAYRLKDLDAETLSGFLDDADDEVRLEALTVAGKNVGLLPELVTRLEARGQANAAVSGLISAQTQAFFLLRSALQDPAQSPVVLRRIARILGCYDDVESIDDLLVRLNISDRLVRQQVLTSLRLRAFVPKENQTSFIRQEIDATMGLAAWCMAALIDLESTDLGLLKAAIGRELDENRERLFRLLSLIYDARHIEMVRESFKSTRGDGKVYALELIDVFVDQEIKDNLFPVLDDLGLAQRLKRMEEKFPQQKLSVFDRLKDIVNRPFGSLEEWTRACALDGFLRVTGHGIPNELTATLFHSNRLLRETAACVFKKLDADQFAFHMQRLPLAVQGDLSLCFTRQEKPSAVFDRVLYLKKAPMFALIPENVIAELVLTMDDVVFEAGDPVFSAQDRNLVFLISGQVQLQSTPDGGDQNTCPLLCRWTHDNEVAIAKTSGWAWVISEAVFCELVADHVELAEGILTIAQTEGADAHRRPMVALSL